MVDITSNYFLHSNKNRQKEKQKLYFYFLCSMFICKRMEPLIMKSSQWLYSSAWEMKVGMPHPRTALSPLVTLKASLSSVTSSPNVKTLQCPLLSVRLRISMVMSHRSGHLRCSSNMLRIRYANTEMCVRCARCLWPLASTLRHILYPLGWV